MLASHDLPTILAFFGPFWVAVIVLGLASMLIGYFQKRREKLLGHELAMRAFEQGATAPEVERLLQTWQSGNGPPQPDEVVEEAILPKKNRSADKAYTSSADTEF